MSEPWLVRLMRAAGMSLSPPGETITFTPVEAPGFEFTEGPSDDNVLRQMLASPHLHCEIEGPGLDEHGQTLTTYRFTPTGPEGEAVIREVMRQIDPSTTDDAPAKGATLYRYGDPPRLT